MLCSDIPSDIDSISISVHNSKRFIEREIGKAVGKLIQVLLTVTLIMPIYVHFTLKNLLSTCLCVLASESIVCIKGDIKHCHKQKSLPWNGSRRGIVKYNNRSKLFIASYILL